MYNEFGSNIFGSDDDIFDEDKSLLDSESTDKNDKTFNKVNFSKNELRDAARSIVDVINNAIQKGVDSSEAEELIEHLKKEHGLSVSHLLGKFRVHFAGTIISGSGSWINEYAVFEIPRSVVYTLDYMSDNKFSLIDRFFNLELENAKRITISRFIEDFFVSGFNNKKSKFAEVFSEGFDDRYLKTYYESLYEINQFTIFQNNGVYAALGEVLGIPCNQDILDGKEVKIDDLTAGAYASHKYTAALGDDLKQEIGKNVARYTERYITYVKKKER